MTEPTDTGLSAVVVNYNGGDRLLSCIQSISAFAPQVDEVILVDNGSNDGGPERVAEAFPEVRMLLLEHNPGPSVARNQGLQHACHRSVLLIDSDTQVTQGAISELLAGRDSTGAAIVCPRLLFLPNQDTIQCDGAAPHFLGTLILENANAEPDRGTAPHAVDGLISTFLLVDRDAALAAGGFNESFFFYFEDLEFGLRMRLLGHKILCASRAVVLHDRGAGYSGLSFRGAGGYPTRRAYLSMRNRLLTIAICFHWRTILIISPALLIYECATIALALARGWMPQWVNGWVWLITNRRQVSALRRDVQTRRCVPDSVVLHGSPLPLADGLFSSRPIGALVKILSGFFAVYWRVARVAVH
ncbi:MAG: glycosyltransferase family 2 protein [Pseudomonadota bacterium]